MRKLLPIILFLFAAKSFATTYYFSYVSGDDSRTMTQAKSQSSPWRSLDSFNVWQSRFLAGDSILFKRGETWPVPSSGVIIKKAGIIISAYGTGAKPVWSGLTSLSGWTSIGTNIWESSTLISTSPNIVVQNSKTILPLGRYPNLVWGSNGPAASSYLTLSTANGSSSSSTTQLTDPELPTSPSWAPGTFPGAEVVVRMRKWKLDRCQVTAHAAATGGGSTITFTPYESGSWIDLDQCNGYFFQDHPGTLDQQGEWWYNPSTKKLRMYSTTSPTGVGVCQRSKLLISNGYNNVKVQNISFIGSNLYTVELSGSGLDFSNCVINFSGQRGVSSDGGLTSSTIQNDSIINSCDYGMRVNTSSCTIRRNYIKKSGAIPGMGRGGSSSYDGIYFSGSGNLVEYNSVDSSGYIGIHMVGGNDNIVRYNKISNHNFVKDDGGGLYTQFKGKVFTGDKWIGNIVYNGLGALAGTITVTASAVNIYLDDDTNNMLVEDNTAYNGSRGIYLHNAYNNIVRNNRTYNNRHNYYIQGGDGLGCCGFHDNRVVGNIFYAKVNSSLQATNQHSFNSGLAKTLLAGSGTYDSNYYAKPLNVSATIHTDKFTHTVSGSSTAYWTLTAWKDTFNFDTHSSQSPYTYSSAYTEDTSFFPLTNPSEISKLFTLNGKHWKDIKGNKYLHDTIRIKPYGSALLFRDTGIVTTTYTPPKTPVVSITSPLNNAQFNAGSPIILKASARDDDGTISKVEFYRSTTLIGTSTILNGSTYDVTWLNPAAGTYNITAKAYDNSGLNQTSSSITITVIAQNIAPHVTLISPVDLASYTAGNTIPLKASASDDDGTISNVTFYSGGTSLGAGTLSGGYWIGNWINVPAGSYNITAKATDNSGGTTVSNYANVKVGTLNYPTVNLISPALNQIDTAPATIHIEATASDSVGTISSVKFYNGTTLLNTVTGPASEYAYDWTNVAAGTYTLTAVATNNSSRATTSNAVTIKIVNKNVMPQVTLDYPTDGLTFATPVSQITLSATATDVDGTVSNVGFYSGSTLLGTGTKSVDTYTYNWLNVAAGTYNLTARATDNSGGVTSSDPITITVYTPNANPIVSITAPSNNATYTEGATVALSATATDDDGTIKQVEFYDNDTLINIDTVSAYSYNYVPIVGNHTLTAKAIDDKGGSSTAIVNITVNPLVANSVPTVSITAPSNNATYTAPGAVTITASASDADGTIQRVDFYANTSFLKSKTTAPYTIDTTLPEGTYSLIAEATDDRGGIGTSSASPVNITVNPQVTNIPPTLQVTKPAQNAVYYQWATVAMSATATANNGNTMNRVEFYNGTTLLNKDYSAPYSFTWTNVKKGVYTIRVKAIDSKGLSTTQTRDISVETKTGNTIKVPSSSTAIVQ